MYQTMVTVLEMFFLAWLPQTPQVILRLADNSLAMVVHVIRSSIVSALEASLGTQEFSQNMLLDVHLSRNGKILKSRDLCY